MVGLLGAWAEAVKRSGIAGRRAADNEGRRIVSTDSTKLRITTCETSNNTTTKSSEQLQSKS